MQESLGTCLYFRTSSDPLFYLRHLRSSADHTSSCPLNLSTSPSPTSFSFAQSDFPMIAVFFVETYRRDDFKANGILEIFVQDNHSRSTRGVLRGLHYQRAPRAQGKLIQVIKGEIYDVAVDIRRGSPTYGQWIGIHLSRRDPNFCMYLPVLHTASAFSVR